MTDRCTTRSMAAEAASTQPENHDLSTNQGTEHGVDHHGQGQHRTNLEHPIPADDNRLRHATGSRYHGESAKPSLATTAEVAGPPANKQQISS